MTFNYFDSWQQFTHGHPLQEHSVFLFDCDGLLLDTEPLYTTAACQLIKELSGMQLSGLPATLKRAIMGQTRPFVAEKMTSWLLSDHQINCDAHDWSTRVLPIEESVFAAGCALLPGAQEIVKLLSNQPGNKLALATSSHRRSFTVKSGPYHDIFFSRFSAIICGDELGSTNELGNTNHSKPHPRIFQVAHAAVNCNNNNNVPMAFEDSLNGVMAH